ncbi:hypothetical protein HCU66_23860 [Pseudomonas frederiksbergensis]|uniref:hypothetical protein n=1 Tax=Pseudomonas frederiksbergensis TaxID=104087 RepID=UPI0019820C96|nr:hypothetical protein [Pseudomonas frederiksbergensis]MBN3865250.1 hypothetical protein [Pseudomonas frederiksbergensis]
MTEAEILSWLFSNDWPKAEELASYAISHHGYVGDDGYYGMRFRSDLDEFERTVEGAFIPEGFFEIMYWDGDHKEIRIPESNYIFGLKKHLLKLGYWGLATGFRLAALGHRVIGGEVIETSNAEPLCNPGRIGRERFMAMLYSSCIAVGFIPGSDKSLDPFSQSARTAAAS